MRFHFFRIGKQNLPIFLQSEINECGLACLAMVANYHGHDVNLSGLRRRFPISNRGVNLKQIIDTADQLELQCRPLKLDLDDVKNLKMPCIIHWNMNHFVVLKNIKGHRCIVHDPAFGEQSHSWDSFSKGFTGIALELQPTQTFAPVKFRDQLELSQLYRNVQGLSSGALQSILLSSVLLVMTLAMPVLMKTIFDEILVTRDAQLLSMLALGASGLLLFRALANWLRGFLTLFFGQMLSFHASSSVYKHILRLPLKFFENRHMGDIVSRFMALEPLRKFLTEGLIEAVIDGVMMILMFTFMLIFAAKLAAISLIAVFFYIFFRWVSYHKFRRLSEEIIVSQSKQSSNFMESIRAMQSIKLYGGQVDRHNLWQNLYTQELNAQSSFGRFRVIFQTFKELIFGLERILILYFGVDMVFDSSLSAGMLIAFLSYKDQFTDKISLLVENVLQFKMLDVQLDRLSDIVLHEAEPTHHPKIFGTAEDSIRGQLEVKALSYRYDEESPFLFHNLDCSFAAGESVAIVGPSGSGKTTLLKILLSLFEPDKGQILVDGCDLKLCRFEYQKAIATVMQDDQLLSGSIADNIAFFDPEADTARIVECAKMASIHSDILSMPMSYQSSIGEMGSAFSGGQKQRILLARALYRRPKFLFLDEATSHLDSHLERQINDSIRCLPMTRIIIAHRKETILSADRILLLKGGQLVPIDKETYA